jgi:hypothetical protein
MAITASVPTWLGANAPTANGQILVQGGYEQQGNAYKAEYTLTLDGSATSAAVNFIDGVNGIFPPSGNQNLPIASVTESSTTVTVTLQQATLPSWLTTNAIVTIAGVQGTSAAGYNLANVTVTGTSSNTFTYTAASGLTSPATANTGTVIGVAQVPTAVAVNVTGGTQVTSHTTPAVAAASITSTGFTVYLSAAGTSAATLVVIANIYR